MTRTHYEILSLEMVVRLSQLILVVEKSDPFVSSETVSILPSGSKFTGRNNPPYYEPPYSDPDADKNQTEKNYPPFKQTIYHFRVIKELFNATENSLAGKEIQVVDAADGNRLGLHTMYYLEGLRKSPIFQSYEPSLNMDDPEKIKNLIIFINPYETRYIFSCEDSYESSGEERKVIKLINQN